MNKLVSKVLSRLRGHDSFQMAELTAAEAELIAGIKQRNLTYLPQSKLASIVETIRGIEQRGLSGVFLEAGCALGGSTILISKMKSERRPLRVYDVFEMIPPPTALDGEDVQQRYRVITRGESQGIGGDKYYGYEKDLYQKVQGNLRSFGVDERAHCVTLVKGLLQNTLRVEEPVAFVHIDVDWYDPVKTCLERIVPRLVVGGSIILDDYADWSGCRKATDEYFSARDDMFSRCSAAGSLKITRVRE